MALVQMTATLTAPVSQTVEALVERLAAQSGCPGKPSQLAPGTCLITQYHPAKEFFLLSRGQVEFHLQQEGLSALPVGRACAHGMPVGWSGLRPPLRYPVTVTAVTETAGHRWPLAVLRQALERDPLQSQWLLAHCLTHARRLLDQTRYLLCETAGHGRLANRAAPLREITEPSGRFHALSLLQRAAFFEGFSTEELQRLVKQARPLHYRRGETLLEEGAAGPGLLLLATGQVSLHRADRATRQTLLRSLSLPGQVVAWSGITADSRNDVTVIATKPSQLCLIPADEIAALCKDNAALQSKLLGRLLWLVGNHLRSARAMLLSRQETREVFAVRNLIEQSSPELRVTSPLHKVPHLLEERLTLGDAFSHLEKLQTAGEGIEPRLANLCLDLLHDTHAEWEFFLGLQHIYDAVVNAPPDRTPEQLRAVCAETFTKLFHGTPHLISGTENLPDEPGHIVIMNHLSNHPFNTLPNGFQLTLDSHFVASMVLHRRYGDPGVRVVRYGSGAEYGHQRYYDRLGHIHVYTADSGIIDEERLQASRADFFEQAAEVIRSGKNLVICPEGSSGPTITSPGVFKSGAFSLASRITPEPMIIPIVVANFDRQPTESPFAVSVLKPFRTSVEFDSGDQTARIAFLEHLRVRFARQRRMLVRLSEQSSVGSREP